MDYKNEYLQWINLNKSFVPKGGYPKECTYLELMTDIMNAKACTQDIAKIFYDADRKWKLECEKRLRQTALEDYRSKNVSAQYFCTLNFNHQTFSVGECVKLVEKILSKYDWVLAGEAVFENYRKDKKNQVYEHPHCHMILDIAGHHAPSKIAEKLYRVGGMKDYILKKSFVDAKFALAHHYLYIKGEKAEEKMDCCARDRKWREKNGIPHNFLKPSINLEALKEQAPTLPPYVGTT